MVCRTLGTAFRGACTCSTGTDTCRHSRPSRPYPWWPDAACSPRTPPDDEDPHRRGDHQCAEHPGPGRGLGRLLGAVPQRLPDPAELLAPAASEPEPDAAESCEFTDSSSKVYSCTLREGLKFSNGHTLDAKAVKYSIDRIKKINVNGGPAGLLGTLDRMRGEGRPRGRLPPEASPTRPSRCVLTTPAMSIVDPEDYPADKLREDGKITGSGPVQPRLLRRGRQGRAGRERQLQGLRGPQERRRHHPLLPAVRRDGQRPQGQGDRRSSTGVWPPRTSWTSRPTQTNEGLQIVENRHHRDQLPGLQPQGPVGEQAPRSARRSPRSSTVRRSPTTSTRTPSSRCTPWSPRVWSATRRASSTTTATRSVDQGASRSSPRRASPSRCRSPLVHHGPLRLPRPAGQFDELKRQLDGVGAVQGHPARASPWKTFQEGYQKGEYPVFGRGWFPDFPDPTTSSRRSWASRTRSAPRTSPPRSPDSCCPSPARESDRGGRDRGVRAGPADPRRRRRGCCRCGRASCTSAANEEIARRRACPRPADDHADVGAVPEDQLVAAVRRSACRGRLTRCQWPPVGSWSSCTQLRTGGC